MISITSSFLHRLKPISTSLNDSWEKYVKFKISRDTAHNLRKKIVSDNGIKIVDRKLKKEIKNYCGDTFGSKAYWPWLAVYTELRGEFKSGWIPYDYYRFNLLPTMNPTKYMRISEAKTLDHRLFNGSVIAPIFIRVNGNFYDKEGRLKQGYEIERMLKDLDSEIIIKAEESRRGKGVHFMDSKSFQFKKLSEGSNLVIQKVVKQHEILNNLNSESLNTFRVTTYIDFTGNVKILFAKLKFGGKGSRIDNPFGGGGWIFVHQSGKTGDYSFDAKGKKIGKKHRHTELKYSELELPFYKKVVRFCQNQHLLFPHVRIIGWDVYVNEDGEPKLIEWNANNPGFWPLEAHYGPFFDEKDLKSII